jgi:hypothetical protein
MRRIILSLCVLTAACSGGPLNSPTSPTGVAAGPGQVQARGGTDLPFDGSFTRHTSAVPNCPPTCPPTTLTITGTEEGTATHLGRFTAVSVDVVDAIAATSTGTFTFTAANGDQLFASTAGGENSFIPPNESHVTLVATVSGGTGRFADATGSFTIDCVEFFDFAAGTASGSGTFKGTLNLNR